MNTGIELIAEERQRQLNKGWSREHDTIEHAYADLAVVAAVVLCNGTDATVVDPLGRDQDPWGLLKRHRNNRVRQLMIAGALIAAEIDRVQERDATPAPLSPNCSVT